MRVAGIMSGTSLDGIDVAIMDIRGSGWKMKASVVAFGGVPYPARVREALLGVSNREAHVGAVARLNVLLAELYAEAVFAVARRNRIAVKSLDLIGCHGQTIFHDGAGARFLGRTVAATLQIGDGSLLAERTGVPVISDFRTRDMAAGGRGAPLVPFVDYLLFRDPRLGRVALNIGGIANLTAIPAGGAPEDAIAFDTGPGNMVIDALARRHSKGKLAYDRDSRIAARGRVDESLLRRLLADRFYRQPPPKTAGREQYGAEFLERLPPAMRIEDAMATETALTAASIAMGIDRFVRPRMRVDELIASGGGVRNPRLMAYLAGFLPGVRIRTSSEFGIDADAKEAIAFAILAYESLHGRPSNLPSATGARGPVVLGKLSP
ncbi:MAG: anhydro-N-acetylmuramic acid kinase [Bryobacteraceae bacterium]|nr:anhydro-N-acetylmuramic acid kinase [Bryobacteraceae bacterium]